MGERRQAARTERAQREGLLSLRPPLRITGRREGTLVARNITPGDQGEGLAIRTGLVTSGVW